MKFKKCKWCNGAGKYRPDKNTNYKIMGIQIGTDKGWVTCTKCYGKGVKVK